MKEVLNMGIDRLRSDFNNSECYELNVNAIKDIHKIIVDEPNGSMRSDALTFLDIDETLVHTIGNLTNRINRGARMLGFKGDLPSCNQVIEHGGTQYYANVFGLGNEAWEDIMIRVRRSSFVNEKAEVYHQDTGNVLSDLDVVGYLSARPATLQTFESTSRDLFKFRNFPKRPVVLRPETTPITQASYWKSNLILNEFGQYIDYGAKIILVDDSISTARAIAEINHLRGKIIINQILFKGPLTIPVLESGKYTPKEEDGIYVSDWENMVATFDRIKGK